MALTAEQEKELKQLKTINSPVPSQKKRILKLQQLKKIKRTEIPKKPKIVPITNKYSLGKKGKPFVEKPKDDNKSFVRGLRSRVRKDQLAKTPNKPTAANDELGGPLKVKKKKPLFKLKPDRKTTTKQRMDKVDARLKVKQKEREQKLASSFPLGTGETIERKKDTRKSPGNPSIRAKAPVVAKKVKPVVKPKVKSVVKPKVKSVVKPKVKSVVKPKVKLTQSEKILKAQPKPTVKPSKAPTDKDQEEINKNVKADPKITAKSLPAYLNNPIFKKEIEERGGIEKFEPNTKSGKMSRFGRIGNDSTNKIMAETVYKTLDKNENKTAAEKKLQSELYSVVMKRKGGMVKRNMGGPAKPRKKTVFRRGGGQALRGFGKATYSNKMY